jgi:hypothetical protein
MRSRLWAVHCKILFSCGSTMSTAPPKAAAFSLPPRDRRAEPPANRVRCSAFDFSGPAGAGNFNSSEGTIRASTAKCIEASLASTGNLFVVLRARALLLWCEIRLKETQVWFLVKVAAIDLAKFYLIWSIYRDRPRVRSLVCFKSCTQRHDGGVAR